MSNNQAPPPSAPGGWRKRLGGLACLLTAAVLLAAIGVILVERFGRQPIQISGTIDRVGSRTHPGQFRRTAINAAALQLTLKRALVKGRYQPVFGHQPSIWPTDEAEDLAQRLPVGTRVRLTVDRRQLVAAKDHLLERHRLEQAFGIYEPPMLGNAGGVAIIALEADGALVFDTSGEYLEFGLVVAFCLLAMLMFGAVGLALVRGTI
ncbi:MAG: hypothetical protein QF578_16455 [Alphaproteobacteria bacterium]|jgi:hypothetical protein|nr:hypothetical protein [Alphaproteobacteria bacterium]MDP6566422.1 hypothetical protein [Alphaproteobacteria bacterium]MDP6811620.1 hypothetical protein [Alphaproteobacteria bacterium]